MKYLTLILVLALSACASGRYNRDYADTSFHGVNQDYVPGGIYTSPHTF